MLGQLTRNWWVPVVRGALGIVFGLLVFAYPTAAAWAFVLLFGVYALLDGFTAIGLAFDTSRGSGWLVLSGIVGILAGILAFLYPLATAFALVYIVAAWALVTGLAEVISAFEARDVLGDSWMLGLSGVLSILLGVLLFSAPGPGLFAWVWLVGIYAIAHGILYIVAGFRLKSFEPSRAV